MTTERPEWVTAVVARVWAEIKATPPADGVYLTETPPLRAEVVTCKRGHQRWAGRSDCGECRYESRGRGRTE